jgi:hypothetical protein
MNKHHLSAVALAVSAVIATSAALSEEPTLPADALVTKAPVQQDLGKLRVPQIVLPAIEDEASASDSGLGRLLSGVQASGTTLNPPVTINYSGSSNAVSINDTGSGRALSATITNSNSGSSALYGQTNGNSAGVKGVNAGTGGSGGVFQVTDASSAQPGLSGSTSGTGNAIVGQITKSNSYATAIIGSNTVTNGYGIGVQGNGGYIGVTGYGDDFGVYGYASGSTGYGLYGYCQGAGVEGNSYSGYGLYGYSYDGDGVYGYTSYGIGVYAYSSNNYGVSANSYYSEAIRAHSVTGLGIYAISDNGYGIWGQSHNQYGVIGEDSGSGIGVYGSSVSGYAGYFAGKLGATSFVTLSDRNAKTAFSSVSGSDILERISALPITSWTFKGDPSHRHVGPMAQDFHAAFGLNGDDDTHINLSDSAGVSLAAIQELTKRLKQKDAQIAEMKARVNEMTVLVARNDVEIAQMKAMNERVMARMAKLEQQASVNAGTVTARLQGETRVGALAEARD